MIISDEKEFEEYSILPFEFNANKSEYPSHLLRDGDRLLMIISKVGIVELKNGRLKVVISIPKTTRNEVIQFKKVSDSIFYIGREKYLQRVNILDSTVINVPFFKDRIIRFIGQSHGVTWISVFGAGVFVEINKQWLHFNPAAYPQLIYAHELWFEGENVFISTNSGLLSFRTQDVLDFVNRKQSQIQAYVFDQTDGLTFNEFNGGAQTNAIKIRNGSLVFPTLKGLCYFELPSFNPDFVQNNIIFQKLVLDGVEVDTKENLILQSDYELLNLKIAHPHFGSAQNAKIYYRIPEISETWEAFNPAEEIRVRRLPAASYSVEIYLPGLSDPDRKAQKLLKFEVEPPFTNSALFYFMIILGILLMSFATILIIRIRAERNRKMLEKIIEERTEELSESNIQLEDAVGMREKMISIFAHDIRGPLRFLKGVASGVKRKAEDKNYTDLFAELNVLLQCADSSYNTAESVLSWIEGQIVSEDTPLLKVNVSEVVEASINLLKPEIINSELELLTDLNPELQVLFQKGALNIIVVNILQNAIKYSLSEIEVKVALEDEKHVVIEIQDNGGGIQDPNVLKDLNSGVIVKSRIGRKGQMGAGLGLYLISELAARQSGSISYQNQKEGLLVKVLLKYNQN